MRRKKTLEKQLEYVEKDGMEMEKDWKKIRGSGCPADNELELYYFPIDSGTGVKEAEVIPFRNGNQKTAIAVGE